MGAIQRFTAEEPDETVRQATLCVRSSTAADLAETGAPAEELAAALTPEVRAALPIALRGINRELAPASTTDPRREQIALLAMELGRASTLVASYLDEDKRADWVSVALAEVENEPFQLVMEGIAHARRSCKQDKEIVPTIIAYVAPRKARLEQQRERFRELMEAAG